MSVEKSAQELELELEKWKQKAIQLTLEKGFGLLRIESLQDRVAELEGTCQDLKVENQFFCTRNCKK